MQIFKSLFDNLLLPMLKDKVIELLPKVLEEKDKEIKKVINNKVNDVVDSQCEKIANKIKKLAEKNIKK